MKRILTIALLLALAVSAVFAQSITEVKEEQPKSLTYTVAEDPTYGAYTIVESKGYTPFVYIPASNGSLTADKIVDDMATLASDLSTYGAANNILAASNAGIFYNWNERNGYGYEYCYAQWEPDGVVIANGVVIKSTESIDHTECDPLIITAGGQVGWADYFVDADALVAGKAYYYDINGNKVLQSESDPSTYVVSAVTGFVPILVGGEVLYDETDDNLTDDKVFGLDNYVGHYAGAAARTVFAANEEGYAIICANGSVKQLAELAKNLGYTFAYNLDGGRSVALYVGEDTDGNGVIDPETDAFTNSYTELKASSRKDPTYIVFTSTNQAPVSATPKDLVAEYDGATLDAGIDIYDLSEHLIVIEVLTNAAGNDDFRRVYSLAALKDTDPIQHSIDKFSSQSSGAAPQGQAPQGQAGQATPQGQASQGQQQGQMPQGGQGQAAPQGGFGGQSMTVNNDGSVKTSTSPAGTLYYTKADGVDYDGDGKADKDEIASCARANSNNRSDNNYYDYSTGYTLSTTDNLSTAGEKTITVSYAGLTTTFKVTLK
ncbi:MAG: phosphodiester glycosidase family protein [Spirochaetales bacterium]|nr:phosphodiester glycosidase family protein [Spirochaetales bacterium]